MKKSKLNVYLILSILMTLIIWSNSLMPSDISSSQSGFITTYIQAFLRYNHIVIDIDTLSFFVRKYAHFVQFFIVSLLWFNVFFKYKNQLFQSIYQTLILGLIIAVIDETIQLFSVGRAFAITDIMIDVFGVLMALSAMYVIKRRKK